MAPSSSHGQSGHSLACTIHRFFSRVFAFAMASGVNFTLLFSVLLAASSSDWSVGQVCSGVGGVQEGGGAGI